MHVLTIEHIIQKYGLKHARVHEPQKGYRNVAYPITHSGDERLNLIVYKSEPGILQRIHRANKVSDYAATQGLPSRQTQNMPIVHMSSGRFRRYAVLYNYLPGKTIAWEAYTMKHLKVLGAGLSTLHARLRSMETTGLPDAEAEYTLILEHMKRYFDTPGVKMAMRSKLGLSRIPRLKRYKKLLKRARKSPDRQVLHMDFVRGNVLFGPSHEASILRLGDLAITGILDFEKTACGPRLLDIARTLAFLLVDCKYKSEAKVRKYFLHSGYHKRGESPLPDLKYLEDFIDLFLLHDFYKFLLHNPYEFLEQNEHFVRTRDLLVRRGLLA